MRTSDREKRVLAYFELDAGKTVKDSQRALKMREHTIRYTLRGLKSRGVIGRKRPIIDLNRLGYTFYTFYFSLSAERRRGRDQLLKHLAALPQVSWLFEVGGEMHYGVSLLSRDLSSVHRDLMKLGEQFGGLFFDRILALQISVTYFGRRYLAPNVTARKPMSLVVTSDIEEIDSTDSKVLQGLAAADHESLESLSAALDIPLATIERRRRRLEERQVIRGYYYWVDAAKIGMQSFVLMLHTRGTTSAIRQKLLDFSKHELSVVFLTEAMGAWDFELGIEVPDTRTVTGVTEKLYDELGPELRTIRVIPILAYRKFRSFPIRGEG